MIHQRKDYDRIQDPANKIPVDEPVFLLRGQDSLASEIVMQYAIRLKEAGLIKQAEDVTAHAFKMAQWHIQKLPDVPKS